MWRRGGRGAKNEQRRGAGEKDGKRGGSLRERVPSPPPLPCLSGFDNVLPCDQKKRMLDICMDGRRMLVLSTAYCTYIHARGH